MSTGKKKTTAERNQDDVLRLPINKESLLFQWACHDDASFHDLSTTEDEAAVRIRSALLRWYRANRRRLPWRGDAPPFDGSTAGTKNPKHGPSAKKQNDEQPTIRNYFATTKSLDSSTTSSRVASNSDDDDVPCEPPLPVTAYGVWVSEIMLQQTRVEAVIPYYLKWMARFPTVQHLADASEDDVNAHWAGLGFYRRARLLHKGAKKVVERFHGQLPQTVDTLMEIDGIGRYTASAIASIAYDVTVPVVDGNVCRVLSRLRGIANHIKAPVLKDDLGWKLAEQIVSAVDEDDCSSQAAAAGEVNQALMELGATYCAPSGTGTDDRDPLKPFYLSSKIGIAFAEEQQRLANAGFDSFPVDEYIQAAVECREDESVCKLCDREGMRSILNDMSTSVESARDSTTTLGHIGHKVFPMPPPKKAKREEVLAVAAFSCSSFMSGERWLLVRRPRDGLLAGQWEFPSVCVWSSDSQKQRAKKKATAAVEVPSIGSDVRTKALNGLLRDYAPSKGSDGHYSLDRFDRVDVGGKPIEHVFSHVRHTMWIEYGEVTNHTDSSPPMEWSSPEGKDLRWMSEQDMKEVGVTAGVKKILKTVKPSQFKSKRKAAP